MKTTVALIVATCVCHAAVVAFPFADPGRLLRVPRIYNALIRSDAKLQPSKAFPYSTPVLQPIGLGTDQFQPEPYALGPPQQQEPTSMMISQTAATKDENTEPKAKSETTKMTQPLTFYPRSFGYYQTQQPIIPYGYPFAPQPYVFGSPYDFAPQNFFRYPSLGGYHGGLYSPGVEQVGGGYNPGNVAGGGYNPGNVKLAGGDYNPGNVQQAGGGYNPGNVEQAGGGYNPGNVKLAGGGYNPGNVAGSGYNPGNVEQVGGEYNPGNVKQAGGGYNPGNVAGSGYNSGNVEQVGGGYNPGNVQQAGGGYNPGNVAGGGYNPGNVEQAGGDYNPGNVDEQVGSGYNPSNVEPAKKDVADAVKSSSDSVGVRESEFYADEEEQVSHDRERSDEVETS